MNHFAAQHAPRSRHWLASIAALWLLLWTVQAGGQLHDHGLLDNDTHCSACQSLAQLGSAVATTTPAVAVNPQNLPQPTRLPAAIVTAVTRYHGNRGPPA